jgi:hypothetical protein
MEEWTKKSPSLIIKIRMFRWNLRNPLPRRVWNFEKQIYMLIKLDQMDIIMCGENPGKKFRKKNLHLTVKHDGGRMQIWGCMAASGVGNSILLQAS